MVEGLQWCYGFMVRWKLELRPATHQGWEGLKAMAMVVVLLLLIVKCIDMSFFTYKNMKLDIYIKNEVYVCSVCFLSPGGKPAEV